MWLPRMWFLLHEGRSVHRLFNEFGSSRVFLVSHALPRRMIHLRRVPRPCCHYFLESYLRGRSPAKLCGRRWHFSTSVSQPLSLFPLAQRSKGSTCSTVWTLRGWKGRLVPHKGGNPAMSCPVHSFGTDLRSECQKIPRNDLRDHLWRKVKGRLGRLLRSRGVSNARCANLSP